jgi:hypothetical protein
MDLMDISPQAIHMARNIAALAVLIEIVVLVVLAWNWDRREDEGNE